MAASTAVAFTSRPPTRTRFVRSSTSTLSTPFTRRTSSMIAALQWPELTSGTW
jgi:hypothetical protein